MILVDTSIWVDHLRAGDRALAELLVGGMVAMHPFVVGEIACGSLVKRAAMLEMLQRLPMARVAGGGETLGFIERHALHGRGLGYVDVHLLASAALTDAALWTRDKALDAAAQRLGVAYRGAPMH